MEPIQTDPVDHARMILVSYIAGALCSSAAQASKQCYLPFGAANRSGSPIGCAPKGMTAEDSAPLRDLTLAAVCTVLAVVFLLINYGNR